MEASVEMEESVETRLPKGFGTLPGKDNIREDGNHVGPLPGTGGPHALPISPWSAGIIYWIASYPGLSQYTGISVEPADNSIEKKAIFTVSFQNDSVKGNLCKLISTIMKKIPVYKNIKVEKWDTFRKHLSSQETKRKGQMKWWKNPRSGGHRSQSEKNIQEYEECNLGSFALQSELLVEFMEDKLNIALSKWLSDLGLPFAEIPGSQPEGELSAPVNEDMMDAWDLPLGDKYPRLSDGMDLESIPPADFHVESQSEGELSAPFDGDMTDAWDLPPADFHVESQHEGELSESDDVDMTVPVGLPLGDKYPRLSDGMDLESIPPADFHVESQPEGELSDPVNEDMMDAWDLPPADFHVESQHEGELSEPDAADMMVPVGLPRTEEDMIKDTGGGETKKVILGLKKTKHRNKHGTPKPPLAPWIAAIIYWIGSNESLSTMTGLSVTPEIRETGEPAIFTLDYKMKDNLVYLISRIMSHLGSNAKLKNWNSVRKNLTDYKWWSNSNNGGHSKSLQGGILGTEGQEFHENILGSFSYQARLFNEEYGESITEAISQFLSEMTPAALKNKKKKTRRRRKSGIKNSKKKKNTRKKK